MLTLLSTVKTRLAIDEFDLSFDTILTNAINAISFRFDKETNRTLARTVNITQEFSADDTEVCLTCCPFESLTRSELKTTEVEGWIEQTNVEYKPLRVRCSHAGGETPKELEKVQDLTDIRRSHE